MNASSQNKHLNVARVHDLKLHTSVPLGLMRNFYHRTLDLPVLVEQVDQITFRAGTTNLTFVAATKGLGDPAYHFAFNIPKISFSRREIGRLNEPH